MKKYVFKWSAVLTLLIISVTCVYLYSNLPLSETPENLPSTPVVGAPQEEDETTNTVRTEFPKAPLLAPFLGCDFLIALSGSGDDTLFEMHSFGGYLYAVGKTNSSDYDFSVTAPSTFVGKLSDNGTLLSILSLEGGYLHSKLTPFGIAVLTSCSTGTTFTVLDFDLTILATKTNTGDSGGMAVLTQSGLSFVSTPSSTLVTYSPSTNNFTSTALSFKIQEVVSLECIENTLYFVANTDTLPVVGSIKDGVTECSFVNSLQSAHSAIPFYDNKLGFTISGTSGGVSSLCAVFCDGEVSWSKKLFQSEHTKLIPIDDGFLLFASLSKSSTCVRLCSHGDVVENCVLSFTNFFPCSYLIDKGEITLLLSSSEYEKSTVATYSVTNGASFKFEFDTTPRAIVKFGEGVTLGLTSNKKSGNFASGVRGVDSYILRLI